MADSSDSTKTTGPILIKKYGNRRLYDTSRSQYITLDDLAAIVRSGKMVRVVEASSERDLTRAVLLQVLLEQQEALSLLPVELLHALLRVQGTLEQAPFAAFLSATTSQFLNQGQQVAQQFLRLMTGFPSPTPPHQQPAAGSAPEPPPPDDETDTKPPTANNPAESGADLKAVRHRMNALLDKLHQK